MMLPLRPWIGRLALATPLALVVMALGVLWIVDRHRDWSTPRWDPATFVALDAPAQVVVPTHEQWVIPVNPDCPHCAGHLERAVARRRAGVTIQALVVDQRLRPGPRVFANAQVDRVWWDSIGVWRNAWGHRLYGETLVFDRDGRLLTTVAPHTGGDVASLHDGWGVPPDDH